MKARKNVFGGPSVRTRRSSAISLFLDSSSAVGLGKALVNAGKSAVLNEGIELLVHDGGAYKSPGAKTMVVIHQPKLKSAVRVQAASGKH